MENEKINRAAQQLSTATKSLQDLDYQIEKFNIFTKNFKQLKVRMFLVLTATSIIAGAMVGAYLIKTYWQDNTTAMMKKYGIKIQFQNDHNTVLIYAAGGQVYTQGQFAILQVQK